MQGVKVAYNLDSLVGTKISGGRYAIEGIIDGGAMGLVCIAKDTVIGQGEGRRVAIKFLRPELDENTKGLFLRESKNVTLLEGHRNIVTIYDEGIESVDGFDIYYTVYEYIEKGNLVGECGKLSVDRALSYTLDICRGMKYAHEHDPSIIHRDIKPANLLLAVDDSVKIADFGLSKRLGASKEEYTASAADWTLQYMSPEQVRNEKPDKKTDIYQAGATLYYLWTGRLPYDVDPQKDPIGYCEAIKEANPTPPNKVREDVPQNVSDMILHMLQKSGDDRPESFGYVLDRLGPYVHVSRHCEVLPIGIIRSCPRLTEIREGLVRHVERALSDLSMISYGIPVPEQEEERWYGTFLLRPFRKVGKKEWRFADEFYPIFFAYCEGEDLVASSDWISTPGLLESPLPVNRCCSGLPIAWYRKDRRKQWDEELKQWSKKRIEGSKLDYNRRLLYIVIRDVESWRKKPGSTVGQTYAGDNQDEDGNFEGENTVGWVLKGRKNPEKIYHMSDKIKTELVIPIYDPAQEGDSPDEQHILGVANFEWDEPFKDNPDRLRSICEQFADKIQKEHVFPLGRFACQVLDSVTRAD